MLIGAAAAVLLVLAPLLLGLQGVRRFERPAVDTRREAWNWRLSAASALLYAVAFNLTFFLQELFLVLPKAFLAGVHPILFHNNHTWVGANPRTSLLQGTGALAILVSGALCAWRLRTSPPGSRTLRLLLIWMAYNGFMQALPQVAWGSVEPQNDLGMAMNYLRVSEFGKSLAALLALAAIPLAALALVPALLGLADHEAELASARARAAFVLRVATLPALAAIALIVPFRIPRGLIEVLAVPVVVTLVGIPWIQAAAWGVRAPPLAGPAPSLRESLVALAGLLLLFQTVLRHGIRL